MKILNKALFFASLFSVTIISSNDAVASKEEELRAAAQNPIASLIRLPLRNTTYFDIGPNNDKANSFNVQPVIPFKMNEDWNLITRTIIPIVYVEDLTEGMVILPEGVSGEPTTGLGDINISLFASPMRSNIGTWGIGPIFSFPTATDDMIGSGQFGAGPTAVWLTQPSPWTVGVLVNHIWSIGDTNNRSEVNQTLIQYFINYNLQKGWYLITAPIMTANWSATRTSDVWNIPVGGGVGKLAKIGKQPINLQLLGYKHIETPTNGPDWSVVFQLQFLFPTF